MSETIPAPPHTGVPDAPPRSWLADTGLSTRSQLACAWSGIALIVIVVAGFLLLAGYLPPPIQANDGPEEVADFYRDNTDAIRAGLVIGFCGWAGWGSFTAVIGIQLARMQPQRPVLAMCQIVFGAGGMVFLMLSSIILLVTTFRPDRNPEVTQALNDLGWISLFITVPAFSSQALVIGIATLKRNPPVQVYPRWIGYLNVWVAILFVPALAIPLIKTGPFAWQGALVYWLAFVVFFIWILALFWAIRKAAMDEAAEYGAAPGRPA